MKNEKTEKIFAKKIKMLRNERGLSQTELGKIIDIHYTHISRYERGIALPSIDCIKRIAKEFKVSTDYLLFDNENNVVNSNLNDPELLQAFSIIDDMNNDEKFIIKKTLQAFVLQHKINSPIFNNNITAKNYKKRIANSKNKNTIKEN